MGDTCARWHLCCSRVSASATKALTRTPLSANAMHGFTLWHAAGVHEHLHTWVRVEGKGTWVDVVEHTRSFPLELSSKKILISNYFTVRFKVPEMSKGKLKITYQLDNLLVTSQTSCSPKSFHVFMAVSLGGWDCQWVEYFT